MVDTKRYNDWFKMAHKDFNSARILYEHDADLGIVCFHCQQAIEKYLKGYLIFKSGVLMDGHSLVKLCKKAMEFDKIFSEYVKDCAFVSTFYIETRYPAEDPMIVTKDDAEECLRIAKNLIELIDKVITN